jgi:O-antigen/teichoic acid export membrane protein
MRRRVILAAGGLTLCVVLALVGGWPDPGRTLDLLTGRSVTGATESAFVILLCWLAALLLAVVAARTFRGQARVRERRSQMWSLAVLVLGVALLGAGIARHGGYQVCCATPATAQQAEHLVH